MMATRDLQPRRVGVTCRCGIDVALCERGCTFYLSCGGYVREGHTSDCTKPHSARVYGRFSRPSYTGSWWSR